MKRALGILLVFILTALDMAAQRPVAKDFKEAVDSVNVLLNERMGIEANFRLERVRTRGDDADFYFTEGLGDYPWRSEDLQWFRKTFFTIAREAFHGYKFADIYSKKVNLQELPMPQIKADGLPQQTVFRKENPRTIPLTRGRDTWSKGLSGRHIALWQSHGLFWSAKLERWMWQRAGIHRTVEDLYTQSYVLPFLIPMLENAGAVAITPRERDTQPYECVCDNDPSFEAPRTGFLRRSGTYIEKGRWSSAGEGFADAKEFYGDHDNPFLMGTARMTRTGSGNGLAATATWRADIPESGDYAVYVSYKTLPESTTDARYTVIHKGGNTTVHVNQKIGGGTWVYIGTFPFNKGGDGCVRLSSASSDQGVVSADAVRFGGGMGKADRGGGISGVTAFVEGALGSMQYGGLDMTLLDEWDNDYTRDFAGRGVWAEEMRKKGIPFDLSLAIHSDAGVTPNDSIVGTLAIYTYKNKGSFTYDDGESRMNGRLLSDFVQTQVVQDIRALYEPEWTRRGLLDRGYSESRSTGVPALLLELLSHQNFADMRYGLDPAFRFNTSRAIYKGVLKYLSARYGCPYAVQPLPVNSFQAALEGDEAFLRWEDTPDSLELTAMPNRYRVYTRIDDGAFDQGTDVSERWYRRKLKPGHVYSFKVEALNDGGRSFPSEILAVGTPDYEARKVLIVNNFTRVSAPTWFDTPQYAGFTDDYDSGVPWGHDILFGGPVHMFRRNSEWTSDQDPGFGATFIEEPGRLIAGNSFDYAAIHGKAMLDAGYAFQSTSAAAWDGSQDGSFAADIICGKQVTTRIGRGAVADKFQVFPVNLREAICRYTEGGGHILISGAYIATDAWDTIYQDVPREPDATREFISKVLGYRWVTNFGDYKGDVVPEKDSPLPGTSYNRDWSDKIYRVEYPDGIAPSSKEGRIVMRYGSTKIGAAVFFEGTHYRTAAFGFPLETTPNYREIIPSVLKFFTSVGEVQSQEAP